MKICGVRPQHSLHVKWIVLRCCHSRTLPDRIPGRDLRDAVGIAVNVDVHIRCRGVGLTSLRLCSRLHDTGRRRGGIATTNESHDSLAVDNINISSACR